MILKYRSNAISIKNTKDISKPNEDFYLCDDNYGIYVIADGVSRDKHQGKYPNPSPAADVSKIFVNAVYRFYLDNYSLSQSINKLLFDMVQYGNEQIQLYNAKQTWDNDFFPGTVGIVGIMARRKFCYAYIGDCSAFLIHNSKKELTRCQTKEIAKHRCDFDSKTIRNFICNNKQHPFSYGVLNGDARAIDFLEYGDVILSPGDKILLCTDGFFDALNQVSASELYHMSFKELSKHSNSTDDKTLIIIEASEYV